MNETWVTISGHVGSVSVHDLEGGGSVTTLRVASTPRRLVEGEWRDGTTAWHTVKAWRALATNVAASVHTGDPVLVHGRVVAEEWTRRDGTLASGTVVVASAVGHDLSRGTASFQRPSHDRSTEPATGHGSQPTPATDGAEAAGAPTPSAA